MYQMNHVYPVQAQAPVYPAYTMQKQPVSPNLYQYNHPQTPAPTALANDIQAIYNQGMMFNVKKGANGNYHIKMAQPEIKDGWQYEVTKDGSLIKYSGWTSPEVVKDNCEMLKNAYQMFDSMNSIHERIYNNAMSYVQSGKPIY